jgi:lipopolysaccharide transport system ATP-binding protein
MDGTHNEIRDPLWVISMSNEIAIRVRGLGKKYIIGGPQEKYLTMRDAIVNSVKAPFHRNPDKNLCTSANVFWALKDVSFDVHNGEVVGIIGRNGAGKSTLLKILSRITAPTEGTVELHGRVGSLLEVGTGFHPEMTGRENIFLNGSILGMKKIEIEQKFEEIVKFAEIDKFIDTPVKRYSSGMYVRLAFAVAAHLEPEILVVDEVLAVGDAGFQKKCLGKMGEVAKEGRTVLFVSHNMGAIGQLCDRCILLENGNKKMDGPSESVIAAYLEQSSQTNNLSPIVKFDSNPELDMQILSLAIYNHEGNLSSELDRSKPFIIQMEYQVHTPVEGATIELIIETEYPIHTFIIRSYDSDMDPERAEAREKGIYLARIEFPGMLLNIAQYQIRAWIWKPQGGQSDGKECIYNEVGPGRLLFTLHDKGTFAAYAIGHMGNQRQGLLAIPLKWEVERKSIY